MKSPKQTKAPLTRREWIKRVIKRGLLGAGGGTLAYGAFWEPYHPYLTNITVPIKNLPPAFDGLRIAHLSDLHIQPAFPAERLAPALDLVRKAAPDLVVLTGDYVWGEAPDPDTHMKACADRCGQMTGWARYGVYASFGNHDYPEPPGEPPVQFWHEAGIQTLQDTIIPLTQNGQTIYLAGLPSFTMRPVSPAEVLKNAPDGAVKIVLWHEPDRAEECARAGASLQLSGHTHGGQVRLPFIGAPILPPGGRRYPMGLYQVNSSQINGNPAETMPLYVTRGVGMLLPWVRFCCPPEVTVVTLARLR